MTVFELTATTKEVMEYLWKFPEGTSFREVYEYFTEVVKKDWKRQTLFTYITILVNQGFIRTEGTRRRTRYIPAVTKDEYSQRRAEKMLGEYYDNSLFNLVSAFQKENRISREEADKLIELLK